MGIVFAGFDFEDYGIKVDSVDSWRKPERDRTLVHVTGRNGDLILDNGCWKNIQITYRCIIKDGWEAVFPEFVKRLYSEANGYQMLFDDAHPGEYRMAEFAGPIEPTLLFTTDTGVFNIVFNCKPVIYIIATSETIDFTTGNDTASFDNDYGMESYPMITVFNASNGAFLTVNGGGGLFWNVELAPNSFDRIRIDCELETCVGYDEDDFPVGNASNLLTITQTYGEESYRDFPFFLPTSPVTVTAYHTRQSDVYTGTAEINPRFTRI